MMVCLVWKQQPHFLGMSYYVKFLGGLGSNGFYIKWRFGTHGSWKKIKILGAFVELPAKQLIQPILPDFLVNGPKWLVAPKWPTGFWFFQLLWVPIIHGYLCVHIFWVYYFSLSHSGSKKRLPQKWRSLECANMNTALILNTLLTFNELFGMVW